MKQPPLLQSGNQVIIKMDDSKKLFLIDGHSLMFRMYYAFLRRPMINSKGVDTSVIFGFMKYILELIKKENPSHIAIAFDPPCKTFRHEIFPQYKANRSATPEVIKNSLEPLVEIIHSINIPVIMINGYEADDVIGAMAKKGERDGYLVYMVSPDKDFGQLISDKIIQFKPGKRGAENEIVGKKEICDKFCIDDPKKVIDILAIWGDASDNVPGVKGIGEIGAKKLISQYGSIENIIQNLDKLPLKQQESFKEAASYLDLSRYLVTIKTDIDIPFSEEDLLVSLGESQKTRELFTQYELFSLLQLLPSPTQNEVAPGNKDNQIIKGLHRVEIEQFIAAVRETKSISINIDVTKNGSLSIYSSSDDKLFITQLPHLLKEILEDDSIKKIGYNLKLYIKLLRKMGITLNGYLADIELMHYLINPERGHKIELLSHSYLNTDIDKMVSESVGNNDDKVGVEIDLFSTIENRDSEESVTNALHSEKMAIETSILTPLYKEVIKDFERDKTLIDLYEKMEMPLIRVLADMEYQGFKIDTSMLARYGVDLGKELSIIEERIRRECDEPDLNIASPTQLGIILFEKLKLDPKAKKNSKGNYSTDEETLLELSDTSPIINDILQFRGIKKIISTYIDPLPSLIDQKTGKIHTTFNQSLTATGRLSSVKPNLQNIPIRTEMGREIRRAFISSYEDGFIVSADYSQIELRIMAALSSDPDMTEAFREGKDIHTSTASKIFKVTEDEVSREQRSKAKVANFGIIYGISSFGLSQRLHIPRKESKILIDEYFANYPKIHEYIETMKEKAKKDGYVETLLHRKRYLPNIHSKNQIVRGLAERNAVNAPIQGTAADIIKLAMINVYNKINELNLRGRMILQVHDELLFDVPKEEVDTIVKLVTQEMENVLKIGIPLTVECNKGINWLEAH